MSINALTEMKPYAGEKSGHKNMRDVDTCSVITTASIKESFLRKLIREELINFVEAAGMPAHELDRAMKIAKDKLAKGMHPLQIGWKLEEMGFMPNVVDAVIEDLI